MLVSRYYFPHNHMLYYFPISSFVSQSAKRIKVIMSLYYGLLQTSHTYKLEQNSNLKPAAMEDYVKVVINLNCVPRTVQEKPKPQRQDEQPML